MMSKLTRHFSFGQLISKLHQYVHLACATPGPRPFGAAAWLKTSSDGHDHDGMTSHEAQDAGSPARIFF